MSKIDSALLSEFVDASHCSDHQFDGLCTSNDRLDGDYISFIDNEKYMDQLRENPSIKAAIVDKDMACLLPERVVPLLSEEPRWAFFSLLNKIAESRVRRPTEVSRTARISANVYIDPEGVVIGDNVIVEPGVTIMRDVSIGADTVVRAGAVLGVNGFEHKRTSRGVLSVEHDGNLIVGKNCEIGPNCTVIKGFGYRDTVVGHGTKLDAQVHYAHGVQSGEDCFIAASVMLAGHVSIGNGVWIGPGALISNRISLGDNAFVTIGSVVTKDVASGQKVTGNFAIPHDLFMQNLKKSIN